jgi:hypothetical protein
MEELKELVKIVTNRGQKNFPLLNFHERQQSKEMKLFSCISQAECPSDEAAAQFLYEASASDVRYKMVKSRLRKRLLNHLFFLDFSSKRYKVWYRDEQECLNLLHHARTLIKVDEFSAAEKILYRALNLATDLEFTNIIIDCHELLLTIFSQQGKQYHYYKHQKVLFEYRTRLVLEQEAESHYLTAKLELNKSIQARKAYLPVLTEIIPRLKEIWEQGHSFNTFNYYYLLYIWYQELSGNFNEIIHLTAESEQLLKEGKINQRRFDHRYNKFISVYAHLRTKSYANGLQLAQEYVEAFDNNSTNWFAFMENYLLMAIHARNYRLAIELFTEANQNPASKKLNRLARERWSLYQKYLYFINPSRQLMEDFTYQEFIASVPEYSKDKQGFNVAILILQFLYFLQKRDIESLLHRIEALRKYAGTHLRDNFSHRTRTMFRLLMLVVKEDFNPKQCRSKGKYLYDRLPSIPPPGDAFAEIEIIPYEHIWEIILNILQNEKMLQNVSVS